MSANCPIVELDVQSFERTNELVLYPIKIKLYTNQVIQVNYQYPEFIQFSKLLYQEYPFLKKHQLLKLNNKKMLFGNINYLDKQLELELFCKQLMSLPSTITSSNTFLSFFIKKKEPINCKTLHHSQSISTIKKTFSFVKSKDPIKRYSDHEINQNLLSYLIQQQQQQQQQQPKNASQIKLKIIYDKNNIIVIRIPRSMNWQLLKSKIIHKFSLLNIYLPNHLIFRIIDNVRNSIMSTSTISSSSTIDTVDMNPDVLLSTLLANQEDLDKFMNEKWTSFQKVTLQCLV